uniref:TrbI/VirB10 family protein n=1 Tax=Mesorhizobium sp. Mes31 TaxID=2926017 RepID=UPI002811627A
MSNKFDPGKEEGRGPANDAGPEAPVEDDAWPLTGEPAAAMRLRAEPPRVTRLSRKALAGLGLAASLAVGGALIYALQNRQQGQGQELYSTDNRSTPDGLAGLPKDYAGVPKLGPALPGDLGRPILNAQNGGPAIGAPSSGSVGPDPEEQRREQELEAARTARLFASMQTRPASDATVARATTDTMPQADLASLGLAPQPATPSAQDRQLAFLNQPPDKRTVSSDRVAPPASKNVLQAGAVIAAALITGVRSDLPGQITAQVTENVYDSPTGH